MVGLWWLCIAGCGWEQGRKEEEGETRGACIDIRDQACRGKRRQARLAPRAAPSQNVLPTSLWPLAQHQGRHELAGHRAYRVLGRTELTACQKNVLSMRCGRRGALGENGSCSLPGRAAPRSPTRKRRHRRHEKPHAPTHKHKAPAALGTNDAAIIFSVTARRPRRETRQMWVSGRRSTPG